MHDDSEKRGTLHRHHPVTIHVVGSRNGVPYELERQICSECSRVLDERTVRRAAA
jgi:hypothetical protein